MLSNHNKDLLAVLEARFNENVHRHERVAWADVCAKLAANEAALVSLAAMEETGGEPDVVVFEKDLNSLLFCDCSPESPLGRRNLCYDREALDKRKHNKPQNSALDMAASMGIELMSEKQYQKLQEFEEFDLKTSSWIITPDEVRNRGGALFCDRRYNRVFVFHNGADSYYASRGFRGILRV